MNDVADDLRYVIRQGSYELVRRDLATGAYRRRVEAFLPDADEATIRRIIAHGIAGFLWPGKRVLPPWE